MEMFDRSIRAWEPMEGEQTNRNKGKPWIAFKIFRDLGPDRSLKKAAALYFDVPLEELNEGQYSNIKKWSAKFDWFSRVQAFDDRDTMIARMAIEEHEQTKAHEFIERQFAIREKILENAEKAVEQQAKMLDWPLTEQRMVRTDEDGEEVTYVFMPAKWSKATAMTMHNIAASAVAGTWVAPENLQEPDDDTMDTSSLSEEEALQLIGLLDKAVPKPPETGRSR